MLLEAPKCCIDHMEVSRDKSRSRTFSQSAGSEGRDGDEEAAGASRRKK